MTQPDSSIQALLRQLPAVEALLIHPALNGAGLPSREILVQLCREHLAGLREAVLKGRRRKLPGVDTIAAEIRTRATNMLRGGMDRVINASGVILHTGLGRAPLPEAARERLQRISASFADLEFRLEDGKRGVRHGRVAEMLRHLCGAEDAIVCNNNAAAVLLMLNSLCNRREVLVSRGQQVEIGGGFRIPDVIRRSGARMIEVGSTNRTHLGDYEEALGPRSAALLRVHTSNYRVIGFHSSVALRELAELAHDRGLLLLDDLGSGALVEMPQLAEPEPVVAQQIREGADLVTFSGDKMLGASQAGILAGRADLVKKIGRNPLMRALRLDKLTLAVLESVLQIYLEGGEALQALPVHRMLGEGASPARARCLKVLHHAGAEQDGETWRLAELQIRLCETAARTGSGALPEQDLPSAALRLDHQSLSAEKLHRRLRGGNPAVVGAVRGEALWLDGKTLLPGEEIELAACLRQAIGLEKLKDNSGKDKT